MYKQEQIKPYEGTGDKGKLVEEMFDNIAPTYGGYSHIRNTDRADTWKIWQLLQQRSIWRIYEQ